MYGPAMVHEYFPRVRAGEPWRVVARSLFGGAGSLGNGGAMRVAPLGAWFADRPERLVDEARRSAEVTHAHEDGIAGAIAVASATAWACRLRGSPPSPGELLERVLADVPDGEVRATSKGGTARERRRFVFDATPPVIEVQASAMAIGPVRLTGKVDDAIDPAPKALSRSRLR